jgi:hypothetical protein
MRSSSRKQLRKGSVVVANGIEDILPWRVGPASVVILLRTPQQKRCELLDCFSLARVLGLVTLVVLVLRVRSWRPKAWWTFIVDLKTHSVRAPKFEYSVAVMPRPCLFLRMFPYLLLWHLSNARPDFDRCARLPILFSANNVHEANTAECFDSGLDLDPCSFEQSRRTLRINPSGNNCDSTFILVCLFV